MAEQIQLRRGTAAAWAAVNPTLAEGEIGYETDTRLFKIGTGSSAWIDLPYIETGGGENTAAAPGIDGEDAGYNWPILQDLSGKSDVGHGHYADGTTITGTGTVGSPFVAVSSVGQSNQIVIPVREMNVSSLVAGQVCYVSSSNGSNIRVGLADCDAAGKFRTIGLASNGIGQNATGTVTAKGVLTGVDTRTSNAAINPNAETWAAGDFLYLSTTPGGYTNVRPPTGRTDKIGYTVKGNSNTDIIIVDIITNPVWLTASALEDVVLRVGDTAGVNKVSIRGFTNTEVASIDSQGNISSPTTDHLAQLSGAFLQYSGSGEDGADGRPGLNGADGATGAAGPAGLTIPGRDGEDGDTPWPLPGPQGSAGASGANGANGADGLSIAGRDGEDGDTPWPLPGVQGATGATGAAGLTIPGRDGEDGDTPWPLPGPAGIDSSVAGPAGAAGLSIPGKDGEDGDTPWPLLGPQGIQGIPGTNGASGADGLSIVGRDGEDGDTPWPLPGPQGAPGADGGVSIVTRLGLDGADGDDGWTVPGPQGPQGAPGAGGSGTNGTATIDFGAFPGANETSVNVTGQTGILVTSIPIAFVMADDTSSGHTASDHRYVTLWAKFVCGTPTAGVGFTIYGRASEKIQGNFTVRWSWAQ